MFPNMTSLFVIINIIVHFTLSDINVAYTIPEDQIVSPRHLREIYMVLYQPRHIHLSYGYDPTTQMVITWSTVDSPKGSIVEYGVYDGGFGGNNFKYKAVGSSSLFQESGSLKLTQYIHRVTLSNLVPGQSYIYHCGSDLGWSELFFFRTMKAGTDWIPHLAIFGDLGNVNAQTLTRLQREVQTQTYDAIIHVGDMGYDLDTNDGLVGDAFMTEIQPVAAYVPYMTVPGNHEYRDNFKQYKARFTMPGLEKFQSQVYSWNMGPIHFIGFSTEFFYFLEFGLAPVATQYYWLENDLKEANAPENRTIRPWIITYGHRPMYCSNANSDDCTNHDAVVRVGLPYIHSFGLEDLFMQYGVDLSIWAHEHSYERMWPLYNYQVFNGTYEEPYRNPGALVHVTTGSAGCLEKHDPFPKDDKPEWSAFRSIDYGYSRLKALNATTLYFEQMSEDKNGEVIDSFYLIRDKHEPYTVLPVQNVVSPNYLN